MSDDDELDRQRPSSGARFLFRLEEIVEGGARARYQAWVLTPADSCAYAATLVDDGTVEMAAVAAAAPEELATMLNTMARLIARGAAGKRADGLPPWPPRVLRWRGPGR